MLDFNETPFMGAALDHLKLSPYEVDPPLSAVVQPKNPLVERTLIKSERLGQVNSNSNIFINNVFFVNYFKSKIVNPFCY